MIRFDEILTTGRKDLLEKKADILNRCISEYGNKYRELLDIDDIGTFASSKGLKVIDFDKVITEASIDEIMKGIKVELEHTDNLFISLVIALHHLEEHLNYYIILLKNNL